MGNDEKNSGHVPDALEAVAGTDMAAAAPETNEPNAKDSSQRRAGAEERSMMLQEWHRIRKIDIDWLLRF